MNFPKYLDTSIVNVEFGKNITIVKPVNLYDCKIGDEVRIGPFVEIQSNISIGASSKIQSHTFICELVEIGENCFIGHGVCFINDTFSQGGPAKGDKNLWRKTIIESNVSIGSNATILPVSICQNVVIGAGSVVTKDIVSSGIYAGNPAKIYSGYLAIFRYEF